jgi:hypothetical protein
MPAEMSIKGEMLLVELALTESAAALSHKALLKRVNEIYSIARPEMRAAADSVGRNNIAVDLIAGKYRSEVASLSGEHLTIERRRLDILRQLEAFPQFGASTSAVDISVEHDGERGFTIRIGGRASHFKLPAIIDRGVWRGDGRYERGDAVTCDGSLWIAREDNPNHEPGKGSQWRLAVVKGKNGRDARSADRG